MSEGVNAGRSRRLWVLMAAVVLLALLGGWLLRGDGGGDALGSGGELESNVQEWRLVGLAPSVVEVLFALDLGDAVVGVSEYSAFPAEALELPKVAGYAQMDREALLALQPSGVVMLDGQAELEEDLESMGIAALRVEHQSIVGILDSFGQVAKFVGGEEVVERARQLRMRCWREIESWRERLSEGLAEREVVVQREGGLRVLVVIGREWGTGRVRSLRAAGARGYHQDMLAHLGLRNAYAGRVPYPELSAEHLLAMQPEVIVEIVGSEDAARVGVEAIKRDWQAMEGLEAVAAGRLVVLAGDVHFVPGPRFVESMGQLVESLLALDLEMDRELEVGF